MMQHFPLLDLQSAWHDAQQVLAEIDTLAATLLADSEETWTDMAIIKGQALAALTALGVLPSAVLEGIAKDQADLQELEDRAEAASY